jgi:hypothetical protein
MRKKIEWKWEKLDQSTWRSKAIGGWLIKSEYSVGKNPATAMQFLPDRDHEWTILVPILEKNDQKSDLKAEDFSIK